MDENKRKALDLAMKQVDKAFGKGAMVRLGDKEIEPIDSISTGSLGLDIALGIGGVPRGRVIEVYGPESSGKTTLALQITAQAQKAGGICAFIDAEHALDVKYAKNLGVDVENLLVSQPDFGEQALDIVETVARSGAVDVIVIDSVAALTPKSEIEGDMGDQNVGVQARLMSKALRKITAHCSNHGATVIFINQIRHKIGVTFGSPEVTTGGQALKFFSSVRLDIRRISQIKAGEEIIGSRTRIKVVKNKMAPPFKKAEFELFYNRGISRTHEILDLALEAGVITKAGAWYYHKEQSLGQGRENSCARLEEDPLLLEEISEAILTDPATEPADL